MRSLLTMAAVAAAAILLSGCRERKHQPVPGPQSQPTQRTTAEAAAGDNTALVDCPGRYHGVGEISWFQGTLEEGFARRTPNKRGSGASRTLFRD